MASKTIKFEIVTPEKVVLKKEILEVSVPTTTGEITILPDHIPLISILKVGVIEVKLVDGSIDIMASSGGFIEVMKDKVVILADTAERAEELDEELLKEAYQRAAKLKEKAELRSGAEFLAINARLEKELARGRALKRWKRINIKK